MWGWLNRDLLPMKAHYFLFNAGTAPVQSFVTVYAKQLGFSSSIIGIIFCVLPIVGMFCKLFVGALADRHRKRKTLFISFLVVGTVTYFSVQFVPSVRTIKLNQVDFHCKEESNLRICSKDINEKRIVDRINGNGTITCFMSCSLTDDLKNQVCLAWNVSKFCSPTTSTSSSANTLIPESTTTGDAAQMVDFDADVPLLHSVWEKDCLFLRVANAVFYQDNSSHIPECSVFVSTTCEVTCADGLVNELMQTVSIPTDSEVASLYQFWLLFSLLLISWVGMAVVVSLSDTICFELLGDRASQYGLQRLWGAVGWGSLAIITGVIVDYYSEGSIEKNYTPAFYLLLILWSADIACSTTIKDLQTKVSRNIWIDVGRLILNPRILVFLLSCVVVGLCTGLQWSFLYWYLDELAAQQGGDSTKWIKTLQGLVSGVQCFLGELPYYFISGLVLQRVGHIHCMSLILFFLAVRLFLYSFLTDPWWTLPIELFQGVYGLFYPTMTSYANAVAPPGTEATVQGLVGALFEGVGVALGSLLGGYCYEAYSGALTFRIFGITAMCACFLHVGIQHFLAKRAAVYSPKGFAGLSNGNEAVAMLEVT